MKTQSFQKGQTLVELLLVMALAAIILPALLTAFVSSRQGKAQQGQRMQAIAYFKEAEEAVRSVRNSGWTNLPASGTYHPVLQSGKWTLAVNSETIGTYFTRQVVISDVTRDANGTIVQSGGTFDPSTKKAVVSLTWIKPYSSTLTSTLYFTRTTNLTQTQTTVADFTPGTLMSTVVTNTSGGEVTLGAGNANWCRPQDSIITAVTLPKQGNVITAQPGSVFIGSGDGTAGVTFMNVGITTPPPPSTPSAAILATYSSSYQTNGIFSDGTYAYLATNGSSSQVVILDISHQPYTKIGWIDVPSGTNANGVYVANNIAYVTSSNILYKFDVTNKVGPHSAVLAQKALWIILGEVPLAKQVVVVGSHVYVGTANTLFGLQVFDTSSLRIVGVSNLTWNSAAQGLSVNAAGTRGYVAFNSGGFFSKGFYIVNTSAADPPSWWPLPNWYPEVGHYNAGTTDPRGMAIAPGSSNKALLVGIGGTYQYHVIDISDETNPTFCGGLPKAGDPPYAGGVTGVTGVQDQYSNVYSYILSGESKNLFKIIQGGNGGVGATNGTFESTTIDPTYSTVFNRFFATISQTAQSTIQMQVAVAPPVNGTCSGATFTYVGPGGTSASYFTSVGSSISAQIPLGNYSPNFQNPGQCFRYKTWFSITGSAQPPVLNDMTVNYSP